MGICGAMPDVYAGVMHGYNEYDTHNLALLTTEKSDTRQWEKPHFFMGDFTGNYSFRLCILVTYYLVALLNAPSLLDATRHIKTHLFNNKRI